MINTTIKSERWTNAEVGSKNGKKRVTGGEIEKEEEGEEESSRDGGTHSKSDGLDWHA